jgi:hypothetical protein
LHARSCTLLLCALTLALPLATADFRSAGYVGGSPTWGAGFQCNTGCFPNGPSSNFGGYEFAPDGKRPVWAYVQDSADVGVFVNVCQDVDDDGLCGEAGEPAARGCGGAIELEGFHPGRSTHVFVYSTRVLGELGVGVATTGFVTLQTE